MASATFLDILWHFLLHTVVLHNPTLHLVEVVRLAETPHSPPFLEELDGQGLEHTDKDSTLGCVYFHLLSGDSLDVRPMSAPAPAPSPAPSPAPASLLLRTSLG